MTAENSVAQSNGVITEVARATDRGPRQVRESLAVEVPGRRPGVAHQLHG